MLDLKTLEDKLDKSLENETKETLNAFLSSIKSRTTGIKTINRAMKTKLNIDKLNDQLKEYYEWKEKKS